MSDLRSMLASLPQSDSRTLPPDTLELFEQLLEAAPDAWKIDLTAPPDVSGHSPQQQADLAVLCVRIAHGARGKPELERAFKLALVLLPPLLRAELPFSGNDLLWAVEACNVHAFTSAQWPVDAVLNALAHQVENEPLTEALSRELRTLQGFCGESDRAQWNRCREAVTELLDGRRAAYAPDVVDAWTLALRRAIVGDASAGSAAQPDAWRDLLQYCSTAKGSKPSKRWLKQAREHIEPVGVGAFVGVMQAVLDAVGTKAPFPVTSYRWGADNPIDGDPTTVDETRADQLRGLIWACLAVADDAPIEAVGDAAERCFQKVPMHGPRAPKVGNACTYVLSELPVPRAVSRLSRLATKVKHASTRKTVEKALQRAADREGITPLDLEEMAVPTYGFTEPGHRVDVLGDFEAELTTNGTNVTLSFRDQDGKVRKSVPVAVKRDFAEQLKALRKTVKELRTMAGPWRARLERMLLTERTLSVKAWNERYAHHPALAPLTRRLLWTVGDETVVFDGEQWNDLEGKAVEPEPDHVVKLWHPLDSPTDVVKAWRARLDELGITQPFKQAHREIYVLTDAERATGTYSNRFAAHVIRQHLFHALCRERGWKSVFLGPFDSDGGVPHKDYPELGLRAEFWVDGTALEATSDAGVFLYVSTDQVRFTPMDGHRPMALEDVEPRGLSEIFRDVDLFVSVTSVGADPTWVDGGPNGAFRDYWSTMAFGELGETAKMRHEALQRLVPRLNIADRCRLTERFLEVQGDLRTYRIHVGSGNILMAPDNQYLCIVQDRKPTGAAAKVHLPFEGDSLLSLILSKAFLLAHDRRIKDPTILSQIRPRE